MVINLSSRLNEYFPKKFLKLLEEAGSQAEKSSQSLYLVGGVVRDLILGRVNLDLDLVVEGDAISFAGLLAKKNGVKLVVHPHFGTAKLKFEDFNLDIATARREIYRQPGALPDVQPGTIEEDLFRRDFSINAMAIFLNPKRFGELIDAYNGQDDISSCLIRVLHTNSFRDDATRIFRAFRYEQRLDFCLEPHTSELVERDYTMIGTISGDRLRHELMLVLEEEIPERVLIRLEQFCILKELHPSLSGDNWLSRKFAEGRKLQKENSAVPLYLCLLIYRFTQNEHEQFLKHLNFSKILTENMRQTLVLKTRLESLERQGLKNSDIYGVLNEFSIPALEANMLATDIDIVKQRISIYLTNLMNSKPILNGRDLKKIGVPSGPEIGKILNALLTEKLNGNVKTKLDEEEWVLTRLAK
jgi:tRNA nucleotidyltransferase (CCA-adding enzyme)